jgi:hypothetical protein
MLEDWRAQHLKWEAFEDTIRTFIWDNIDYLPSGLHRTVLDNIKFAPSYVYGILIAVCFILLETFLSRLCSKAPAPKPVSEMKLKEELAQISGAIAALQRHKANLQQQITTLKAKQG